MIFMSFMLSTKRIITQKWPKPSHKFSEEKRMSRMCLSTAKFGSRTIDRTPKDRQPKDRTPKDRTPKDRKAKRSKRQKIEKPKDRTPKDRTPKDRMP